ncbi:hypothetical protein D7S86_03015 [Pararobbsia silviterrae]|uniref:Uncharacterized protein n=1 Tax=Pararobbsia silviterrae TaxID=1792498 RepID=A0A494Y899_9BURK|nr:hypothetical protein D7S86_03015 [Pararobbsia silviterrae]
MNLVSQRYLEQMQPVRQTLADVHVVHVARDEVEVRRSRRMIVVLVESRGRQGQNQLVVKVFHS